MGVRFIFITLAAQHAMGYGFNQLLGALKAKAQDGYIELQRQEWASDGEVPTRSHHLFSGVPYHHQLGEEMGSSRFGSIVDPHLEAGRVV
jgi:isocitrate lyase